MNTKVTNRFLKHFQGAVTLILIAVMSLSCSKGSYKRAMELYNWGYYGQAAQMFEQVAKKTKDKAQKQEALFYAAESFRLNNDYDKAKKLYEKVLAKDPKNTKALLMHAHMLKKLEKYREAIDAYNLYLEEVPGDSMAIFKKVGCELALRWTPDSSRYVVENFKPANTKENDWAPMIAAKKDNVLFFVSDRQEGASKRIYAGTLNYWSDVWYIEKAGKKNKEKWGKPEFLKKTSTKFNDGPVSFDSRFASMYMTQCGGYNGKTEKCLIYEMKKQGTDWELGEPLEFCKSDSGHSYGHPAMSPDGTKLYFSSDREDGYGGFDIWVVTYSKRSKSWGDPVNLGPTINTANDEYFPYINPHDNNLYFASDGWPGIGGLDIFKAKPTEDVEVWKELENLREPINSGGDDFGITFLLNDKSKGFFTSNRGDKRNNDDIYSFDIKPLIITITGVVTDCNSKKPLVGATVILSNNKDTSKLRLTTDATGRYRATLMEETNYSLRALFPQEYYLEGEPVNRTTRGIKFSTELVQDFCLENPLDKVYTLPIFYDLDSSRIRPDAAKELDRFAKDVMLRYPRLTYEFGSHTDCRASAEYNEKLAQRRADSAVAYLVRTYKIDPKKIIAKGYGETQLINDCKCEGSEVTGMTPYNDSFTKKMIVLKDERGNVIKSYYEPYSASEIKTVNGKQYVACDEYQHQQNRRTTVRMNRDGLSSRVRVDQDKDKNNNNGKTTGTAKPGSTGPPGSTPNTPKVDLTNAIKVNFHKDGALNLVSATVGETETIEFAFDMVGKYTAVPPEVAAEWLKNKVINKGDFQEGEKLKVGDVKLPSNKFTVPKITIGGYELTNVTFTITDQVEKPTLGKAFFRGFKTESYIDGTTLILIPKKVAKKPKEGE